LGNRKGLGGRGRDPGAGLLLEGIIQDKEGVEVSGSKVRSPCNWGGKEAGKENPKKF